MVAICQDSRPGGGVAVTIAARWLLHPEAVAAAGCCTQQDWEAIMDGVPSTPSFGMSVLLALTLVLSVLALLFAARS
jgi:ABC-type phosphate transport system permease subunit